MVFAVPDPRPQRYLSGRVPHVSPEIIAMGVLAIQGLVMSLASAALESAGILRLSVGLDGNRLQGGDARDDRVVDCSDALASSVDAKAFGEINGLAEHDNRATEDAAGQPAPQSPGVGSAL